MNHTIWNFPLKIEDEFTIEIPVNAKPLHIDEQAGIPTLWCLVNPSPSFPVCHAKIYCFATGRPIPNKFVYVNPNKDDPLTEFLGTVVMSDGFVWHYFIEWV